LDKVGFNSRISIFFSNYLIDRQTQYSLVSSLFRVDVDIDQGSALFPILSTLYIVLIFYIFEKRTKNLLSFISVFTLSFIDDSFFISQEKKHKFIL